MSIAQRFVAGEGEAHPSADEFDRTQIALPSGESGDAAALQAFATDSTNLPWIIFRAAFRASLVDGLTARARALLAALARTVDASRPYAAIYARRELLNNRSLLSRRTLYRALDDLEAAGLIQRAGQLRITSEGYEGQFGRTYLHFTETAGVLLGFAEIPAVQSKPQNTPRSGTSDSSTSSDDRFAQPSATVALGANNKDLYPSSFQKRQPGQLPEDLERLQTLGFSKFLVFNLMRAAREHGKRLSDVVEATWTHLKKADRPICYLRSLLRSPIDFTNQLRARQADAIARRNAKAERTDAARFAEEAAGRTYVDHAGKLSITVDSDGKGAQVRFAGEATVRREAGDWALRLMRAFRSGRIRIATAVDMEALIPPLSLVPTQRPHTPVVPRTITPLASEHLTALRALVRVARPLA
jgi:hypothetical protein